MFKSVHRKTRQEVIKLKSPISLKLGTNVWFDEKIISHLPGSAWSSWGDTLRRL